MSFKIQQSPSNPVFLSLPQQPGSLSPVFCHSTLPYGLVPLLLFSLTLDPLSDLLKVSAYTQLLLIHGSDCSQLLLFHEVLFIPLMAPFLCSQPPQSTANSTSHIKTPQWRRTYCSVYHCQR